MYPTKKQIEKWLIKHKIKSNCNQWYIHTNFGCNKKNIYVNYINVVQVIIFTKEIIVSIINVLCKKNKECNFINFLKIPHPSLFI